jgi:hypothetical protein
MAILALDMMTDDEERALRIELMKIQIDEGRVNIDKMRQEMRWEPYKALAAIIGAAVAMMGATLALAAWLSQHWH